MIPFRERNQTVIGSVGLVVILLLLLASFNADRLPFIGGGAVYQADFTEAAGLRPGDEVRIAGVKVGKVTDVGLAGDHVLVHFQVKGAHFGTATRAAIKIKTVLGQKFLMLTPAGPGQLGTRDVIPVSRTTSPYDVSQAFQGLASTVQQVNTDQLAQAFTTLSDTFANTPPQVRASLTGLARLSQTIASRDQQLALLLQRSQAVTQVLAARDKDLTSFLSDSTLILEEVQRRRAAIHDLLVSTTALSDQLIALVRENRTALAPALAQLHEVVLVLKANQDNLDKALPRLAAFTRVFANNLGNGRWFDTLVQNLTTPVGFGPGTFGMNGTSNGVTR